MLRSLLAHPLTRSRSIDDPITTELRRSIIASKPFLRAIYEDWYRAILERIPDGAGSVLELGSGAGFFDRYLPGLITSEVFECTTVQLVADAQRLPFPEGALRAIVMTDVLHHIPNVAGFFAEAARCLRPGGGVVMVEPWVSPWSSFVYKRFHHEPFQPNTKEWEFPSKGPLSDANGALPWIVFERDRERFESEFPRVADKRSYPNDALQVSRIWRRLDAQFHAQEYDAILEAPRTSVPTADEEPCNVFAYLSPASLGVHLTSYGNKEVLLLSDLSSSLVGRVSRASILNLRARSAW